MKERPTDMEAKLRAAIRGAQPTEELTEVVRELLGNGEPRGAAARFAFFPGEAALQVLGSGGTDALRVWWGGSDGGR
jgi:hypothetical protein